MIFTPSNFISFIRGPLALFFLSDNPFYRTLAIVLAMVTDSLDGYLARRWKMISPLGTILDPIMDKFFVCFVIVIFIKEGNLEIWQALSLISRDFAVALFGLYLSFKGLWSKFTIRSFWVGKISTTLQFFVLLGLTYHFPIPTYVFFCFIFLGLLALLELYSIQKGLEI